MRRKIAMFSFFSFLSKGVFFLVDAAIRAVSLSYPPFVILQMYFLALSLRWNSVIVVVVFVIGDEFWLVGSLLPMINWWWHVSVAMTLALFLRVPSWLETEQRWNRHTRCLFFFPWPHNSSQMQNSHERNILSASLFILRAGYYDDFLSFIFFFSFSLFFPFAAVR